MFNNSHMLLIIIMMAYVLYYRYVENCKVKACNEVMF